MSDSQGEDRVRGILPNSRDTYQVFEKQQGTVVSLGSVQGFKHCNSRLGHDIPSSGDNFRSNKKNIFFHVSYLMPQFVLLIYVSSLPPSFLNWSLLVFASFSQGNTYPSPPPSLLPYLVSLSLCLFLPGEHRAFVHLLSSFLPEALSSCGGPRFSTNSVLLEL